MNGTTSGTTQFALLVVEMPAKGRHDEESEKWQTFVAKTANTTDSFGPDTTLGPNCWLLSLQKMLPAFSHILTVAEEQGLSCRVAFFDHFPEWCSSHDS